MDQNDTPKNVHMKLNTKLNSMMAESKVSDDCTHDMKMEMKYRQETNKSEGHVIQGTIQKL